MHSAYKLNKQGDNIQPWHTPFPIWNQSVVPCPVLTVASRPAYRFLKRQVGWSGISISFRIFHSFDNFKSSKKSLFGDFPWGFFSKVPGKVSLHLTYLSQTSVQFSSVAQSCPTLCNSMDCSTLGLPVHHQLPEFTQTHVHWVGDAIQPSHPLPSPSPPAFNLSQHQCPLKRVGSLHWVAKVLEFQLQHQSFQWTPRTDLL